MNPHDKTIERFKGVNAILNGHFVLSSGLHSDTYVQCAKVTEHPALGEEVCRSLADMWRGKKIDVVAGPAYGGIILAYELARALKARAVFFERVEGKFALRRGFSLSSQDEVLVAEDVVTTGGSAQEVLSLVRQMGARLVGVTSLVYRGQGNFADTDYKYLVSLTPPVYKPEECPFCKEKIPVTKPGSRTVRA